MIIESLLITHQELGYVNPCRVGVDNSRDMKIAAVLGVIVIYL